MLDLKKELTEMVTDQIKTASKDAIDLFKNYLLAVLDQYETRSIEPKLTRTDVELFYDRFIREVYEGVDRQPLSNTN